MTFPLHGDLVSLVPMTHEHIEPLLRATANARDSYRYTLVPTDRAGMTAYVDQAVADHAAGVSIPLVVVRRDGTVVGSTGFRDIEHWPATPTRPVVTVAEIGGTWLSVAAQSTGIHSEAKLLMLDHAFDEMCALRISFVTDARNHRGRGAVERIGATFDGIMRSHLPAADGGIRDSAFYSILRRDWQYLRPPLQCRVREQAAGVRT